MRLSSFNALVDHAMAELGMDIEEAERWATERMGRKRSGTANPQLELGDVVEEKVPIDPATSDWGGFGDVSFVSGSDRTDYTKCMCDSGSRCPVHGP